MLYIDGELSPSTIGKRLELFDLGSVVCVDEPHLIYASQGRQSSPSDFDFTNDETTEALVEMLEELQIGFVIFDNIRTLFKVEDEEVFSNALNKLINRLRKKLSLNVLVVHNSNKSGSYFGRDIVTTFDYVVKLKDTGDGLSTDPRMFEVEKNRPASEISALHGKKLTFTNGVFTAENYKTHKEYVERVSDVVKAIKDKKITKHLTLIEYLNANNVFNIPYSNVNSSYEKTFKTLKPFLKGTFNSAEELKKAIKENKINNQQEETKDDR